MRFSKNQQQEENAKKSAKLKFDDLPTIMPEQEKSILKASEEARNDKNVTNPMTLTESIKYLGKL